MGGNIQKGLEKAIHADFEDAKSRGIGAGAIAGNFGNTDKWLYWAMTEKLPQIGTSLKKWLDVTHSENLARFIAEEILGIYYIKRHIVGSVSSDLLVKVIKHNADELATSIRILADGEVTRDEAADVAKAVRHIERAQEAEEALKQKLLTELEAAQRREPTLAEFENGRQAS